LVSGLRGGTTPGPLFSYKESARVGAGQTKATAPSDSLLGPHIVENEEYPQIEIKKSQVNITFSYFYQNVVICRFNRFWLKTEDLSQWIYTNWTKECGIYLCSKGFFHSIPFFKSRLPENYGGTMVLRKSWVIHYP